MAEQRFSSLLLDDVRVALEDTHKLLIRSHLLVIEYPSLRLLDHLPTEPNEMLEVQRQNHAEQNTVQPQTRGRVLELCYGDYSIANRFRGV